MEKVSDCLKRRGNRRRRLRDNLRARLPQLVAATLTLLVVILKWHNDPWSLGLLLTQPLWRRRGIAGFRAGTADRRKRAMKVLATIVPLLKLCLKSDDR